MDIYEEIELAMRAILNNPKNEHLLEIMEVILAHVDNLDKKYENCDDDVTRNRLAFAIGEILMLSVKIMKLDNAFKFQPKNHVH